MGTGRLNVDHATDARGIGVQRSVATKRAAGRGRITEHDLHAACGGPEGQAQYLTGALRADFCGWAI